MIHTYFKKFLNEKDEHDYPDYGIIKWHKIPITIENKKGTYRSGTDKIGKKWKSKMMCDYGRIEYTVGKDKDCLDVFLNDDPYSSNKVFVIYQKDPTQNKFDELKFMIGFNSPEEAKGMYLSNYDTDDYFMDMSELSVKDFIKMVKKNMIQTLYGKINIPNDV